MAPLVWLVTGTSSGLGLQLVHEILARGDQVIATARDISKLEALAQAGASTLALDVTSSQEDINRTITSAVNIHGRIDVLVNNAGYIAIGSWEDLGYPGFLRQFETNVFGVIRVTNAVLPYMRARKAGSLVFIGSRSGWIGDGLVGAYAGSKFALEGLVEALRDEVAPLGIKTLMIEPGRFRTALLSSGRMEMVPEASDDYKDLAEQRAAHLAEQDMAQEGDPDKLVRVLVDVVREEGAAAGRQVPFGLPIGYDVCEDMEAKCRQTMELIDDWRDIVADTHFKA